MIGAQAARIAARWGRTHARSGRGGEPGSSALSRCLVRPGPIPALLAAVLAAVPIAASLSSRPALAHEFWIEPRDFLIGPGQALVADLKVGQDMKGNVLAFVPRNHTRFAILTDAGEEPVTSRIGDRPAVDQVPTGDGTAVVVHETTDSVLTYSDPTKFAAFVAYEGLDGTLERHAARGLPGSGFREVYSRSVKALVPRADGGGAGRVADRLAGLPVEVMIEGDPASLAVEGRAIRVRVLHEGAPLAGAQVNVFSRPVGAGARSDDGTATDGLATDGATTDGARRSPMRLDAAGEMLLPLEPDRLYLLNAVVMREPSPAKAEATGAVWESLWGATTFSTLVPPAAGASVPSAGDDPLDDVRASDGQAAGSRASGSDVR